MILGRSKPEVRSRESNEVGNSLVHRHGTTATMQAGKRFEGSDEPLQFEEGRWR
jgi:hypothetical protein